MGTNRAFVTGTAPAPTTASALAPAGTVACLDGPIVPSARPSRNSGLPRRARHRPHPVVRGLASTPATAAPLSGISVPFGPPDGAARSRPRRLRRRRRRPPSPATRLFRRGRGFVPGFCVVVLDNFFVRLDRHPRRLQLTGRTSGSSGERRHSADALGPSSGARCPIRSISNVPAEHVRPFG